MNQGVLTREGIQRLIDAAPPLLEDYLDLGTQLQPHGFDLTLREVATFTSAGAMGQDTEDRILPQTQVLPFDTDGWLTLLPGSYRITFNEIVSLPLTIMALARPRSSLLRSGVAIHNAVWEAGYQGRSQGLLVVYNHQGYRLALNARLVQIIFFYLAGELEEGYSGRFQGETG